MGKVIMPKKVMMEARASMGSRLPLKTLSVIRGNTNIAVAWPMGSRMELRIPDLMDRPMDSVK